MSTNQVTPFDLNENEPRQIIANPEKEPVRWIDVMREMGLAGTPIAAKDLIDTTFVILRAKQFESSYKDGEHAWFCVVKPANSIELYSVALGGGAVVEVLDAVSRSTDDRPIEVTLKFREGGKFSGYYYFE